MKDIFHKILKRIAHFQVEHPYVTIALILLLSLAIYGGVSQVRTVASLEQMMPKDIEEIKAFNVLRDNYLGKDMVAVVVQLNPDAGEGVMDIRDKQVFDYIRRIKSTMEDEPDIIETYSFTDQFPAHVTHEEYKVIMSAMDEEYLSDYINDDYTTTILLATTDVSADDPRMNILSGRIHEIVDTAGHPPGTEIKLTGTPVIQQKLGELIEKDRSNTKWISTLFVFILTMVIFGTLTSALVPIIVVTIGVTWLYGTMGYVDLPISTLAGGVAAMVIGIGIDFAIHIMNRFKYERKKGLSMKESIEQAVVDTGTALIATSLTTITAFLAFLVGQMPEMGRFGILMAIGIAYALLFSLFGLPALLIIEEKMIYFLKNRLRFGVEGEFSLKNEDDCKVSNDD